MIKLKKFICFSAGLVLLAGGLLFVFQLSNRQVLSEPEAKQTAEDIAVVAGESNQPATDIDQAETAAKSVKLIIKGKKEPLQYEVEIGDKAGEVEPVIKPVHLLDLVKESIQAGETVVCVSLFEHPFEVAGLV